MGPIIPIVVGGLILAGITWLGRKHEKETKGTAVTEGIKTSDEIANLTLGKNLTVSVGTVIVLSPIDTRGNIVNPLLVEEQQSPIQPILKMVIPGTYKVLAKGAVSINENLGISSGPSSLITVL